MGGGGASDDAGRRVGDVTLLARQVSGIELKDLKSLVDEGKKRLGSGIVAIVGVTEDGRAGLVVGVTEDLTSRFDAVKLVRLGSEALGGKGGGGRPDMAQAGGPDGAKADAALAAIEAALTRLSGGAALGSRRPGVPGEGGAWLGGLIRCGIRRAGCVCARRPHARAAGRYGRWRFADRPLGHSLSLWRMRRPGSVCGESAPSVSRLGAEPRDGHGRRDAAGALHAPGSG